MRRRKSVVKGADPAVLAGDLQPEKKRQTGEFFSRTDRSGALWTGRNRKPVMSKKAKPTPLTKLLKAWTGASPEERQAFLDLVTAEVRARGELTAPSAARPAESSASDPASVAEDRQALIANGRYLLPSTIVRVETVMRSRNMTPSAVMAELGFSPRDTSLTRALAMKAALRLSVIAELALWLQANEAAASAQE